MQGDVDIFQFVNISASTPYPTRIPTLTRSITSPNPKPIALAPITAPLPSPVVPMSMPPMLNTHGAAIVPGHAPLYVPNVPLYVTLQGARPLGCRLPMQSARALRPQPCACRQWAARAKGKGMVDGGAGSSSAACQVKRSVGL